VFWKVIALALLVSGVAIFYSLTLGGLVYLVPVAALLAIGMRRLSRQPDTEFGRWRSMSDRRRR
jgi:hypothetical protein